MTFLHVCLRLVSGSREVQVRPTLLAGTHHAPLHPAQRLRLHHCQALLTEALRKPVSGSPLPVTSSAHRFPPCRAIPLPQHQATEVLFTYSPNNHQRSMNILLSHTERPGAVPQPCPTDIQVWKQGLYISHHYFTPSFFYQPQLNYPYLSPAPRFLLASRLADRGLALCGGGSAQGNQGFAREMQISENHPDMGQRARQGEGEFGPKQQH